MSTVSLIMTYIQITSWCQKQKKNIYIIVIMDDHVFEIVKAIIASVGLVASTPLINNLRRKERVLLKPVPKVGDQQVDTYCVLSWWRIRTLQIAIILALFECLLNVVEFGAKTAVPKNCPC